MSIPTHLLDPSALFEERLTRALAMALQGQTAIVIVPAHFPAPRQQIINWLTRHVPPEAAHTLRALPDSIHFEGSRGQVRIVPHDHFTYDAKQQRLLDYPAGTPTFLHPEVET